MKKKILALILASLTVISAVGCGNSGTNNDSTADGNGASTEEGEKTSGVNAATKDGKTKITAYLSGGGDNQALTDALVEAFNEQSETTEVEPVPLAEGQNGYQMLTVMYNAGNPPAVFYLEPSDVSKLTDKLMDLSDLSAVEDAATGTLEDVTYDGKILGVPASIQGYGLLYSRALLDEVMGEDFDPSTIKTRDDLKEVFDKFVENGIAPVAISPFGWSLGNHFFNQVYSGQSDTQEGRDEFVEKLKAGTADLINNDVFNEYMDTFDLMMEYNYYKDNPLETVADEIDKQAQLLVTGQSAFWFMGNWASNNIRTLDEDGEYAYIPVPLGDAASANAGKVTTLVPGYYCVETSTTTPEQQESAVELINFILETDIGKQYTVDCGNIPAYSSNDKTIEDSISKSIFDYQLVDANFPMYNNYPSDHANEVGDNCMQKYLGGIIDRTELAGLIEDYWKGQE